MGKKPKDKRPAPAASGATDGESEHVRALSVLELVEKLNTVPMFKVDSTLQPALPVHSLSSSACTTPSQVVDDETGDIVPTPDRGGSACICW
jgi:hypothetical protein